MKTDVVIFALFTIVVLVLGFMAGEYYLGLGTFTGEAGGVLAVAPSR